MLIQKCSFCIVIIIQLFSFTSKGQKTVDILNIQPDTIVENIFVKKLYSDTNSTSFVIWVKNEVKSHKHTNHTETIQIIEGTGKMTIDTELFIIKANDFIVIPENSFHSVKVTSSTLLKLVSTQTPMFDGTDRIFEKK